MLSSSCLSGSFSPLATRNCHSTRSTPVISSVTQCSTCSRVFISMNQMRSARRPEPPSFLSDVSAMNSMVPAPTYSTAFAARIAAQHNSSRVASSIPGAGASSITFWWRRWSEQSRSNRWTTLPCLSPNTCTSIWRGERIYFSSRTRSSPNDELASRWSRSGDWSAPR